MTPFDPSTMNAQLLQTINDNINTSQGNLGQYGINDKNEVVFGRHKVTEDDYDRLSIHLFEQGMDGQRLQNRKVKTSEVQAHLQKKVENESAKKPQRGFLQRFFGWGGQESSDTGKAPPVADKAGEGMAAGQRIESFEGKGARPKEPSRKKTPPPPERKSSLPGSPDFAGLVGVHRALNEEEKGALQAPRKQYDEKLAALRKKEQEAKDLFDQIAKVKGSSKKQDNMAMTFAATRGAVNVNAWLNSSDGALFSKASTCVNIYAQEKPRVLNAVKGYCPEDKTPGELASELLGGVRERLESQMYEPEHRRWGRVDNTDKDTLVDLFNPVSGSLAKEEGLREQFQFAKRQRRAEFEEQIWECRVFDQSGKLDVDGTVSKMSKYFPGGMLSESMLEKLSDWVALVERKKNAPYGGRFFELKQGVLTGMGVYDLPGLVSKMTRSEFKKFQDLYEEKIVSGALGKISKSVLVESIVSEEMKRVPPVPLQPQEDVDRYKEKMSLVRTSLENYARAFVEKAMTTLSDTPHIPDDLMNEQAIAYELVEGAALDSWGLKHRAKDEWVKWSGDNKSFEVCSRDESEKSYASNKHLLCCFDEGVFDSWNVPAPIPQTKNAGVGNKPKEELKAWDPVPGDQVMLKNEGGMAFHQIKGMIEESQKVLDEALKEVEAYCEKATNELSRLAGIRLTDGNANIADLSDENRPQKLGEQLSEFYDNQQSDLVDALAPLVSEDNSEDVKIANDMLRCCYEAVCDLVDKEKKGLSDALSMATQAGLQEERYRDLRKGLKSLKDFSIEAKTNLIAEQLMDSVCKKLGDSEYNPGRETYLPEPDTDKDTWIKTQEAKDWLKQFKNERTQSIMVAKVFTRRFLKEACMIIYKMRSHEPPMVLKWKPEEEVLVDRDKKVWAGYNQEIKGEMKVDFVAWPACYLNEGEGALLSKGSLKPK